VGKFAVLQANDYPAGLPEGALAEALGFTAPDDVLVLIRHEPLDEGEIGPRLAHGGIDDLNPRATSPRISSLVIASGSSDSTSDARRLHADVADLPGQGRSAAAVARRPAYPASLDDIEESRAAFKRRQMTPEQSAVAMLGLRLPERGVTLHQVEYVARALGSNATLLPTGEMKITGTFGEGVYPSLDAAANALNLRCFHPGAL
jgi:hypothetical protein